MTAVDPNNAFESLDRDCLASKPGTKWRTPAGRIGAWIADMDFRPPDAVLDALRAVVDSGDLGYPTWNPRRHTPLVPLFVERMQRRHGWAPEAAHCREYDDVIQAVRQVVHFMSSPGDGIVMHTPAYPPFHATWRSMHRRLVEVPAHATADGWHFDYDDLERRLQAEPGMARIWILCNPQNPLGHVFGRAELERIAEIADRHDLVVISDEIHAEIVYAPGRHVPFESLGPEASARTVTLTSASKSFNLAGMRWAVAHVGAPSVRAVFDTLPAHFAGITSIMAATAVEAAWTHGDEWLRACVHHLDARRQQLGTLLATHLPSVSHLPPQATYLAWLDCRGLGLTEEPAEVFRRGGVELSPGPDFGATSSGFVRLNFATSSTVLTEIVERMSAAVRVR